MAATWSVAVFAHNEAKRIAATLNSIAAAADGAALDVVVLANGCRDRTAAIVREMALASPRLRVVEIALGDKANAWNYYVHTLAIAADMHVFVDGDVQVEPGALPALAAALAEVPSANAAGALPSTGRDREAWSARMLSNGTLAGGLYALPGQFVERIRQRAIRLPQGLIGEDWLVSVLAKSDLQPLAIDPAAGQRVVFARQAGFAFRSLSPWRPADYRVYLRRLWRYALRGVQFEIVLGWLWHYPPEALPPEIEQLYMRARPPSRLKWVGWTSPLRLWAVQRVRGVRAKAAAKGELVA
ncbi:Glycosyltransferase involved in cell wall bisynthesis [Rhodoferax sp. OV413]|uniref:glycosyltransferase family 2 protein n=1 Tax=Rhodoferax sp. OV413 TaxID=1855285 RepID=UPI00088363A3|nr:glycosyltransferase family 2 protein [Rhodoferax sp. OV413]SDP37980.1 Glycosyltransferase involved in cell wall bisynthesis [Rhodoferax sp. OV413]